MIILILWLIGLTAAGMLGVNIYVIFMFLTVAFIVFKERKF